MIKKLTLSLIAAIAAIFMTQTASASHIPGGNITYECIGPNQYKVILTLFEDCGTAFQSSSNLSIGISNNCGFPSPTSVSVTNTIYQQEVSQLCPAMIGQSECSGGTLPGIYMHRWEGTVTLPGQCNAWTFSFSLCCRNTSTNLSGQGTFYIETTMNSVTAPCNNSAVINAQPIPYVCAGQNVYYSFGATDADGDSLSFSLIGARSAASTFITYQGGYSASAPIPGIALNSTTGLLTFNTGTLGNFVVVVLITEYDSDGNVTGTVVQDFQFQVINCTNQTPSAPAQMTNYTGGGTVNQPNNINLCVGESACFDLVFSDPDGTQTLAVDPFLTSLPPGCTYTVSGTNPLTVHVCVVAQPSSGATYSILSLNVSDDACPINAFANFNILIGSFGIDFTLAATPAACPGINDGTIIATPDTSGVYSFTWYMLPDTVNSIFMDPATSSGSSMNNLAPGDYMIVIADTSGGCAGIQTITVNANSEPHFNVSVTNETCSGFANGMITATANTGTSPWDYTWANTTNPGNILQNDQNISTPSTFNNVPAGSYIVTATDQNGCTNDTTIVVNAGIVINGTSSSVGETCYNYGDGSITLGGSGGTGPYTYIILGPENDTLSSTTFNGLTAGNYVTYVIDQNGCFDTMNVTVPAAIPVVAAFLPTTAVGVPPYTVNFTNLSTGGSNYFWDFGDTTNSTLFNPAHTYIYENIYNVMLIVTNGPCADTAYGTIETLFSSIEFPNVFSPNGDGVNDLFHFNAKNISTLTCTIFNRWGQEVFSFTDPYGGWNGKDKGGKECADGTYYYILDAEGLDSKEYHNHGTVNLFRKR